MSDELLSAMMDGQCTPEELEQALDDFDRSPALKARWSRMSLVRDALAGIETHRVKQDFTFSVMAAIEAQDAIAELVSPKVVPLRREPSPVVAVAAPVVRRVRRWQPAVGLAAAASITAAVVIAGGNLLTQPVGGSSRTASAARDDHSDQLASLASIPASSKSAEVGETRWAQIDGASARQLDGYLMEHSNSHSESGVGGGGLSYARLAVRSADYRQADEQR